MLKLFSPSYISSGFIAVLVGYSSAAVIVFQAAAAGGASPEQIASWMWALGIGMGVSGIGLSLYYRAPILIAWSTPGAALLATSLQGIPMGEAIGAFLFSSILLTLCALSGWVEKIMRIIPTALASAMLAGVLLRFGLDIFVAMERDVVLVSLMLISLFVAKRYLPRYVIPLTLMTGLLYCYFGNLLSAPLIQLAFTRPVFITPQFSLNSLIGVGIPLFIVTMAAQNIPGIAVLRAHGYHTPASPLVGWSGFCGVLLAPFGGYAFNLAAITAAICMGEDVDPDREKRYFAAIWAGIFYILIGLMGAAVAAILAIFPAELVMAIAGLALLGTIGDSLKSALENDEGREAAILTFIVTASGMSLLSIGAPFWGLLIGLGVFHFGMADSGLLRPRKAAATSTAVQPTQAD